MGMRCAKRSKSVICCLECKCRQLTHRKLFRGANSSLDIILGKLRKRERLALDVDFESVGVLDLGDSDDAAKGRRSDGVDLHHQQRS